MKILLSPPEWFKKHHHGEDIEGYASTMLMGAYGKYAAINFAEWMNLNTNYQSAGQYTLRAKPGRLYTLDELFDFFITLPPDQDGSIDYEDEVKKIYPDAYIGKFHPNNYAVIFDPNQDEIKLCIDTFLTQQEAWQSAYEQLNKAK